MTAADRAFASPTARRATLTLIARTGFAARGLMYFLVGAFAAAAAMGFREQPHGIMDAVQAVTGSRLRLILAASIGLGLACLATYFALIGIWHCLRGNGAKRWLLGAGMLGDAAIYAAVMICVLSLLFGWQADGEHQAQLWTAWVFAKPFGRGLVGLAGVAILLCGIGVIAWVLIADIDDDIDLPEQQKGMIEPIGRYGLSGRGLAVSLVGIYWISAALHGDPAQAHELGGALQSVQQDSRGWLLLLVLSLAFAASALFDFIQALYHRPEPGLDIPGCSN